jgi:thiol-disulfide isomerase/thioredoxin
MNKNRIIISLVACFILLSSGLNGCAKKFTQIPPDNTPIDNQNSGEITASIYPKSERQVAPDFDLPKLDGTGNLTLTSLKGKIVLLDFTTTWCGWCTKQEPQVIDLFKNYEAKGFIVIAVDCREPMETVLGKYPGGKNLYPVILDEKGNVCTSQPGFQGYPYYSLIDKEGKIAYIQSGFDENMYKTVSGMIEYLMDKE